MRHKIFYVFAANKSYNEFFQLMRLITKLIWLKKRI